MSEHDPKDGSGGEGQPSPAQAPTAIPSPYVAPSHPEQVACPACLTLVPVGTILCPKCGSSIPPTVFPPIPVQPPTRKRIVALIVGIALIAIIVIGAAGYIAYNNAQQQVLAVAKSSEQNAANQAIKQLRATCLSVRTDNTHLSQYNGIFYGYLLVYETIGMSNPTGFEINATWTIKLYYPSAGNLFLTDKVAFHLSAHGTARPTFTFQVTGSQLNNMPQNPDLSKFTAKLDGSYAVAGAYATYNLTEQSTYDSTTNVGSGTLESSGTSGTNLPSC